MSLEVSYLNMSLSSRFDMGLQILKSTGLISASFKDLSLDLDFNLISQTLENGEKVPKISVNGAKLSLDEKDTTIQVKGSVTAWIINLVQKVFKKQLLGLLINELTMVL